MKTKTLGYSGRTSEKHGLGVGQAKTNRNFSKIHPMVGNGSLHVSGYCEGSNR